MFWEKRSGEPDLVEPCVKVKVHRAQPKSQAQTDPRPVL